MKGKKFSMSMVAAVAVMVVCVASPALAQVTFDWVTVGNPGNAEDPLNSGSIPGIGSVADVYRIAKYEVTNDQYAEFLNAVAATDTNGLYNANMGSDPRGGITQSGSSGSFTYAVKVNMGNKPVNYVSFFDAMRFVNWLHNGQPSGAQDASTTEDGVYAISDGVSETRAADAQYFIPTENEWYKAAYHQPSADGGDSDDYWLYPTAGNSVPTVATANATGDISNPGVNVANYDFGADWNGQNGNVTTVGSAGALSESFYGTSDQGGNVYEWNEFSSGPFRVLRGGFWGFNASALFSSTQFVTLPTAEFNEFGFRVASPLGPDCSGLSDCSGNGTCIADGVCECNTGWGGADCSSFDCDEVNNCSGNGTCVGANLCNCDEGFGGQDCTAAIPAASTWGLIAFSLGLLVVATLMIFNRQMAPGSDLRA